MIIYLYIKQHSITQLKYFGKTTKNPFKYLGSGKRWVSHIRKHGVEHVQTIEVFEFNDIERCKEFATRFSIENDIVNSKDWANLTFESGTDGGYRQNNHFKIYNAIPRSKYHCERISQSKKGVATKKYSVVVNDIEYESQAEAARCLNVSEQTIRNWFKSGKARDTSLRYKNKLS